MTQSMAEALTRVAMSRPLGDTFGRAQRYAAEQGHRRVTLEHLLLALCEDPDASLVLQACQLDVARLATDASGYIGRLDDRLQPGEAGEPAADPDLMRILEYAAAAAHQSRRREINGAIVLAAIVGEGRSAAAQMLRAQGLTFEETIKALQRATAQARQQPAPRAVQEPAPPAPAPIPVPTLALPPLEPPRRLNRSKGGHRQAPRKSWRRCASASTPAARSLLPASRSPWRRHRLPRLRRRRCRLLLLRRPRPTSGRCRTHQ